MKVWGKKLEDVPVETLVRIAHSMALDNLKDEDGMYNIRSYFNV